MGKSAFGQAQGFVAQWVMDKSGTRATESWSYPGKGFYPKERVHGNAWSLYLPQNAPPKDQLTVEVFKLPNRPKSAYGRSSKIPGSNSLRSTFLSTTMQSTSSPTVPPREWNLLELRIKGGGLSEGYVVELY